MTRHRGLSMVAIAGCATVLAACTSSSPPVHTPTGTAPGSTLPGIGKIKHVVVIMQENRSFDTYFGTYPGADGIPMQNGQPTVCVPDPAGRLRQALPRPGRRQRRRPARPGQRHRRHQRRQDGRLRRPRPSRRRKGCADPNNPACTNGADARRHGLERRPGDPQLLGLRPELRAAGPHVRAERLLEPARAPVHGLGVVGAAARTPGDPTSCVNALQNPGNPPKAPAKHAAAPPATDAEATRSPAIGPTTPGPTSPTCCTRTTCRWGYYVVTGTEPDCQNDAAVSCAAGHAERQDPRHLEPAALLRHRPQDGQLGQHPVGRQLLRPGQGRHPARGLVGRPLRRRSASTRRRDLGRPGLRHQPGQRGDERPRLGLAPRSSCPGTTGAASTTTSPRRRSTRTATACGCPAWSSAPTPRQGYIDHQTLSFDAYVKFIEDDFLGGQRLDPKTDGRPDPRPDVRENASQLGDITARLRLQPGAPPADAAAGPSGAGPSLNTGELIALRVSQERSASPAVHIRLCRESRRNELRAGRWPPTGTKASGKALPSGCLGSTPRTGPSTLAYTDRKSVVKRRSPASRSVRLG